MSQLLLLLLVVMTLGIAMFGLGRAILVARYKRRVRRRRERFDAQTVSLADSDKRMMQGIRAGR